MTRISICILALAIIIVFIGILFIPINKRVSNQYPFPTQSARISLAPRSTATSESQSISPNLDNLQENMLEDSAESNLIESYQEIETKQVDENRESRESDSVQKEEIEAVSFMEEESVVPMLDGYYFVETATQPPLFDRALLAEAIQYPPMAKRQRREGLVVLRLFILDNGVIERIVVEEDPGYGFAQAAKAAFLDMIVSPALLDGNPIPVTLTYPVRFTLH